MELPTKEGEQLLDLGIWDWSHCFSVDSHFWQRALGMPAVLQVQCTGPADLRSCQLSNEPVSSSMPKSSPCMTAFDA